MATTREKILERREKLKQERLKEESKLKALKQKLKATETEILKAEEQEEIERRGIIGKIFAEKMKSDADLKRKFEEVLLSQGSSQEKALFHLPV